jgi:hypothetical protein
MAETEESFHPWEAGFGFEAPHDPAFDSINEP